MKVFENYPLKSSNSFLIDAYARYYAEFNESNELQSFIKNDWRKYNKVLFLGGGSNVLFVNDFDGLVIAVRNKGIRVENAGSNIFLVTAQAGESWDQLVNFCVDSGLGGIENLAMIPGNAGSSPIQNIGAYGVELKDVFHHLNGLSVETGEEMVLDRENCRFGYRNSIFKQELKDKIIITSITLRLEKNHPPDLSYRALREEVDSLKISNPGIKEVREIVCNIRRRKLPDPAVMGNAGSFFKNPAVTSSFHEELKTSFSDLVSFLQADNTYKLAAAWLIEQCGWKGKRFGDAGVHENQALVLVNYGNATGRQILDLATSISTSVLEKFGVVLEKEVNVV